jgi:hypothetical protein
MRNNLLDGARLPAKARAGLFLALVAFLSVFALRACSSADSELSKTAADAVSSAPIPPTFERPAEARRYFDAMVSGDRRAIELIDRALNAMKSSGADPGQIALLQKERDRRAARLATNESVPR